MGERFTTPQGLGQGYWRTIVRALEHYKISSPVNSLEAEQEASQVNTTEGTTAVCARSLFIR